MNMNKRIILILLLNFLMFISFDIDVLAETKYSCPKNYTLSGQKCIKITKAYQRNGVYYCEPNMGVLKGKECELIVKAEKKEDKNDKDTDKENNSSTNNESSLKCPAGYEVYENKCIKFSSDAQQRNGQYYCLDGKKLIGTGCYTLNDGTYENGNKGQNDKNEKKCIEGYELKDGECFAGNVAENPCSENNIKKVLRLLGFILLIAKIAVPIIIIGYGTFDLFKSVIDKDEKSLSKQLKQLGIRVIAGLVVFFIPNIVNVAFSLSDTLGIVDSSEYKACANCLLKPTSDSSCAITED